MSLHDTLSGKTIGNYHVIRKIGHGGMGVVYKAEQTTLSRSVALKFLSQDFANDESFVQRFLREGRIVAKLDHPNIVRVFDIGQVDGLHYVAMELLEGKPLTKLIRQRASIDLDRALHLAKQVAVGLGAAHAQNLVHRDIKPENLMVDRAGQLKILDFGLAKSFTEDKDLTQTGSMLGTPSYMSPEQCRAKKVTGQSDIYSLGVVLYEMLTGQLPFDSENALGLMLKITTEPFPNATSSNPELPKSVDTLIANTVARDTKERYRHVGELIADIERLQHDHNADLISYISKTRPDGNSTDEGLIDSPQIDEQLIAELVQGDTVNQSKRPVSNTRSVSPKLLLAALSVVAIVAIGAIGLSDGFSVFRVSMTPELLELTASDIVSTPGAEFRYREPDGTDWTTILGDAFEANQRPIIPILGTVNTVEGEVFKYTQFLSIQRDSLSFYFDYEDAYPSYKMPLPLKHGDTWTASVYRYFDDSFDKKITVMHYTAQKEIITVPAGTFHAILVTVNTDPPDQNTDYNWWVPGRGLLRFDKYTPPAGRFNAEQTSIKIPK